MELRLKQHDQDPYPTCGFFIEGNDLTAWISALDRLGLDPAQLRLYGLPTRQANVVWGCLVLTTTKLSTAQLGSLATAHRAAGRLIVPAKSLVEPVLTNYDRERLFGKDTYVLHPEFGLCKLPEHLNLSDHFAMGAIARLPTLRPADHHVASGEILAFSVAASPPGDIALELQTEVPREKMEDKPLSPLEKIRLKLYQSVLTEGGDQATTEQLRRLAAKLGQSGTDAVQKILDDFNNLQERNKKEVDKLLSLMQKDPEASLRYAIPLDEHGYSRGGLTGAFKMQDRGLDFSLFGGRRSGGNGNSVSLGDEFNRLREQYITTAKELEAAGKHEKAAYVYLKLLKDYTAAALTLKKGRHYEKAAVVYLRYLKNEAAAAECYETGKIYDEAVRLYKKMEKWEKVGDLNVLQGNEAAAHTAYEHQLQIELEQNAFVKAANLTKHKLHDLPRAQDILLRGWDENRDAYNCLQYYLANIPSDEAAWRELQRIGNHQLNAQNETLFLRVLSGEYAKQREHQEEIRDLAYEICARLLPAGKISAHRLLEFNDKNSRLRADTLRYELGKK
ncbi:MAG: hypothetical protein AAFZ52_16950 [Bacteroidota bacterium]